MLAAGWFGDRVLDGAWPSPHRTGAGGDPAPPPPNGDRDRLGEQVDHDLPAPARSVQGAPRERRPENRDPGARPARESVGRGVACSPGTGQGQALGMPGELIRREALERIIPRAAELRGLTESAASQKTDRDRKSVV